MKVVFDQLTEASKKEITCPESNIIKASYNSNAGPCVGIDPQSQRCKMLFLLTFAPQLSIMTFLQSIYKPGNERLRWK